MAQHLGRLRIVRPGVDCYHEWPIRRTYMWGGHPSPRNGFSDKPADGADEEHPEHGAGDQKPQRIEPPSRDDSRDADTKRSTSNGPRRRAGQPMIALKEIGQRPVRRSA